MTLPLSFSGTHAPPCAVENMLHSKNETPVKKRIRHLRLLFFNAI
jgi:hypothetical protein